MQCSRELLRWRDALQFDEAGKWLAMTENGTWWLWETGVRLHVIRCKLKPDCKRLLRLGKARARENWNEQYSSPWLTFFFFFATELFGLAHDCHQICNSECQLNRDRSSTWWYKHKAQIVWAHFIPPFSHYRTEMKRVEMPVWERIHIYCHILFH